MTENYSFGSWIKRRRKAMDLTQGELAQRVGCSTSTIVKIEADERRPSRQIAELLADRLKVPLDQRTLFIKVARQEKMVDHLEAAPPLPEIAPVAAHPQKQNNLPVYPNPFFGREYEIDLVSGQLLNPICRLLTLTGPGGIGKTRLAVEAAQKLEPEFPDGVFFLPMASVNPLGSFAPVLADALGLVFSGPADPLVQVIHALGTKKALLIFDNMEHLVSESSLLVEILQRAPNVKLLLTSREQVQLQWEWVIEVQGLPVPEHAGVPALESNSAASLFLQRARQVSQAFSPGLEDAAALVRICQLVEGMPLAIELAASWVRVLPLSEIAQELERDLDWLESAAQDIPDRHRSIRAVFDYSWKLLDAEEKEALMKLSEFSGGFTRQTAQAAAGVSVRLLASLLSKSLLRHRKKADRYEFHELIRQYAAAQLHEHPVEEAQIKEKLSRYFSNWIAGQEAPLKSSQQIQAAAQIRMETANWLAAWRWSVQQRRLDLLRSMIPCLYWYYEIHGEYSEALHAYQFTVNELRAGGAPDCFSSTEEISTYAFLVDQLGWFKFRTGNVEEGRALFANSLKLAAPGRDAEVLYHVYGNWGYLALQIENPAEARRLTLESLAQARILGSQWHAAIPISVLGIVELQRGNAAEAYLQLTESLKIWQTVGDPRGLVFCMLYLGAAAMALEKMETAESVLEGSYGIARAKMDRWAQAFSLDLLGQIRMFKEQPEKAYTQFKESQSLFKEIGDQWGTAQALIHLADALAARDPASQSAQGEARRMFREAYKTAQQAKWLPVMIEAIVYDACIDHEIPAEKRLAISLDVLANAPIPPHIKQRTERLRDEALAELTDQQITEVRGRAEEKSPEGWAKIVFPENELDILSEPGVDQRSSTSFPSTFQI